VLLAVTDTVRKWNVSESLSFHLLSAAFNRDSWISIFV